MDETPIDRATLKKLLASKPNFANVRDTAAPILAITANPNATIHELAAVIEQDPELTARLLKIVNSGFYGLRNKVESIHHTIVLLGWNAIKMIAIGSSILTRMCTTDRRLFNHSVRTAQIARFIATEASFYKVEEIAVVGLLHDFGAVILSLFFPERCVQARKLATDNGIPLHLAERSIFGVDHGEVGGWTLEAWNMPENITESVSRHHSFDSKSYHARKTAVIHVADVFALAANYRGPSWEKVPELAGESLEVLGFDENDLKDLLLTVMKMRFDPLII